LSIFLLFYAASNTNAQTLTIKELQDKIEQTRLEKQRLEEENKKLEAQIDETGKQAQTLQNAVKSLDVTQKKLQNNIKVTETNISNTELTIKKVGIEIEDAENSISKDAEAIAESLRTLQQNEEQSLVETMLRYKDINDLWDTIETLKRFQSSLRTDLTSLKLLRDSLESKKTEHESKKQELVSYKSDLSDQKTVVEQNKSAKTVLLSQTKNKEAEYKKLLERNIELGRKFEQELFDYESRLQFQIDKSKLPGENSKVLSWPLNDIYITQRFGKTVDSKKLYVSGTHNGVDFRASMGTAVKSVADGVVQGMGNTDSQAGCYSYGRWLLIKHNNGLSSMYAHLSGIKVSQGDSIAKDQIIGWSGGQPGTSGAGYSTGPHLHLSLYATEGVSIEKYEQSIFCKQVYIPIAASNAYLDPLSYLPAL
jgi:murein DD-endopeptidase MepM/ murein hydrolase activator NlpD